jgi:uncharacterized membrane protein YphA (DoxX/SURF4 family)
MDKALLLLQVIVALGIFNVWFLRFNMATEYRGGNSKNLKEEFAAYGLPIWFFVLIGVLKVSCAILLIVGIWYTDITRYAAGALGFLMVGALFMHIKAKDPLFKSLPAFLMFLMCLIIFLYSANG